MSKNARVKENSDLGVTIELYTSPPSKLLRSACSKMLTDEHYPTAWGDTSTQIFSDWLERFDSHQWFPYLWTVNGELGGLHWAHDYGEDVDGAYTWVGGSVMRPFRGRDHHDIRMWGWSLARQAMAEQGYERLLGACLADNKAAYHFITSCGYHAMGIYREWILYRKSLADCWLFSFRPEDQNLLWVVAERRAAATRQLFYDLKG